jgi:hypothetical protein
MGMAKVEGNLKILLDIDKIMNSQEMTMLENVA